MKDGGLLALRRPIQKAAEFPKVQQQPAIGYKWDGKQRPPSKSDYIAIALLVT